MDIFLKRMIPAHQEPQAGPSGGVLEEGTAITEDSPLCVTALNTAHWARCVCLCHSF